MRRETEFSYELRIMSHGSGPNSGCLRRTAYLELIAK